MLIKMDAERLGRLTHVLSTFEDAECLGVNDYTLDIFELEPPLSLELLLVDGGIDVVAAFELKYDDALDGYYLGDKLEDARELADRLALWEALDQ